jgi:glycerol-3-phosphate acyltransferase PlsY
MVEPLTPLHASLLIAGAYFLGSIPFGLLIARAKGIDVREVGSGNIGATNVARSIGKKAGAIVLLLDALKGAVPAIAVQVLDVAGEVDPLFVSAICFAAIFGHCFPVWLKFKGGKGVATAIGTYLAIDPLVAMLAIGIFIAVYSLFRVASCWCSIARQSWSFWAWPPAVSSCSSTGRTFADCSASASSKCECFQGLNALSGRRWRGEMRGDRERITRKSVVLAVEVTQWFQHKRPLCRPRMRQCQPRRFNRHIAESNEIEVDGARTIPLPSSAIAPEL